MKKIIVFGATGNIGAYFTSYCKENLDAEAYEVIAVGRRKTDFFEKNGISYVNVDICKDEDFAALPTEDIYAVVNAAGLLPAYLKEYDPFAYVETNIKGGLRVLEYARKTNADRVLYTQTWAEQAGYWGKEEVLSPDLPRKLLYTGDHAFYAITKTMIVETMEHYKQEYGVKNFVDKASKGEPIEMWGDPDAFKDILYIKDLCQMMFKALFAKVNGGTYNAGTGVRTTLREQIEGMVEVFSPRDNKSVIVEKPDKNSFVSFVMDIDNAKRELGYEPEFTYIKYLEDYKREQELRRFDELWRKK